MVTKDPVTIHKLALTNKLLESLWDCSTGDYPSRHQKRAFSYSCYCLEEAYANGKGMPPPPLLPPAGLIWMVRPAAGEISFLFAAMRLQLVLVALCYLADGSGHTSQFVLSLVLKPGLPRSNFAVPP